MIMMRMTVSSPRARGLAAVLVSVGLLGSPAASAPATVSLGMPGRSSSTPSVAAAASFVAVAWGASSQGQADVFVAVSRDGGATYGAPVRANSIRGEARLGGELPPRVALRTVAGSAAPEIAVLWTARGATTQIKIARSRDGGKSFAPPVMLQSAAAAGDRGWPALSLDPQGTAHAVWLDHRGLAASKAAGSGHAHQGAAHAGGSADASGLYYASAAAGKASPERELTRSVCYCCKTAMAIGPDGAIYAAWRHVYPGDLRDIAFSVSRDGGKSFAAPARVSEDKWQINGCPDDGPAVAVDAGGTVHVVWPTVLAGAQPEGALFYASTRDGRQFTPRLRIPTLGSPRPLHPQIVVGPTGRIVIAWDETINGQRLAAMRELKAQAAFGEVVTLDSAGPAMYPALAATTEGLVAVWTAGGELSRVQSRTIPLR
jgi:hypothetical protein